MNHRNLPTLATLSLFVSGTSIRAETIIYSDTFTAPDATVLLGFTPETNNGVAGSTYHESNNFWTGNYPVGIFENRAQLGADNQANLPLASSGDFVQPELIGVSALMNMGTTAGPAGPSTTGEQRGVGLGFFAGTSNLATPADFRGLVITTDGRLILAQHAVAGSARAGFLAEIATGIDTAIDHTVAFQINTTTGDISNISLDDVPQPDVETTIFNSDINHVGFMVSSNSGGTLATFDNFTVIDVAASGPGSGPTITSITPIDATTYELIITASAETGYAVAASDSLDFDNSTILNNLTQGSLNDPGEISLSGDQITTDENGNATVRITLTGPKNFVRLQEPPANGP